jgi:hypothetical protein
MTIIPAELVNCAFYDLANKAIERVHAGNQTPFPDDTQLTAVARRSFTHRGNQHWYNEATWWFSGWQDPPNDLKPRLVFARVQTDNGPMEFGVKPKAQA